MVYVAGRTGTAGTRDFLAVHEMQDQYLLTPLSRFEPDAPFPEPVEAWPSTKDFSAPVDQVARMDGPTFFGRLARLLTDNPARATDGPAIAGHHTVHRGQTGDLVGPGDRGGDRGRTLGRAGAAAPGRRTG
jgi:hypothetical protein